MKTKRIVGRAFLAAVLAAGLAGAAIAAGPHAHDHGAAPTTVKLDDGKRWPTDAPLRSGMTEMRSAIAASLDEIHGGTFTPAEYAALAAALELQIEYVTTNCRLPEDADAELHVVLGQIIDGIDAMRSDAGRDGGVMKIVEALDLYVGAFDHPGWTPLTH